MTLTCPVCASTHMTGDQVKTCQDCGTKVDMTQWKKAQMVTAGVQGEYA